MKKLLIYILLAAMALSLAACKNNDDTVEEKVYTFTSGSTKMAIDADVTPILSSLGEWKGYDESTSCAFEGLDKVYTYDGFEINTYPMNGKDYVLLIELYDDTVATEKGIRIGSTKQAVLEAYGTPDQQTHTDLIYNGKGMFLQFILEGETVSSIQYSKAQ